MRVCIIAFANLTFTPYLKKYTDICKKNNIQFDIIFWNRHNISEKFDDCLNLYEYNKFMADSTSIFVKFIFMYRYANYVKKLLRKNKYDKIIVLTSLLGVFLGGYLTKYMKGKYIFDIRDHSYEQILWYYRKMEDVMRNSALNIISSVGFKFFLPKQKVNVLHNCVYLGKSENTFKKSFKRPLIVSFIGLVRYENECKKFIKGIANDRRVEFHFWGKGEAENELKQFCSKNIIKNVYFHGEYKPDQKNSINENTDMIFNAYGTDLHVKYALSNKYYDAMYFKKPLIVNEGTAMEMFSENVSFTVKYDEGFIDELLQWYESLDENEFNLLTDRYLSDALEENIQTENIICEFINK